VGGSVLIVEDDRDLRDMLVAALEAEGYSVRTAENGVEAVVQLEFEPLPEVILLNVVLPVMSGPDVLDAIRRDARLARIPVVLITGAPVPVDVGRAADGVLMKPFGLEQLSDSIGELLATRGSSSPTPPQPDA
jgi:two-component system, chemotaxis family, chemotaxis protein CheY